MVKVIMRAMPCGKWLLIALYVCLACVLEESTAVHRVDGATPDNRPSSSGPSIIDEDAIDKLSEIFDIPTLKSSRHFALRGNATQAGLPRPLADSISGRPPQYMLNLYQTITDSNGIMRIPNPYHANLIKSFSNKDLGENNKVEFDIKSLQESGQERESVLQAEMHLDMSINLSALLANYSASQQAEDDEEEAEAVTCGPPRPANPTCTTPRKC
ncbi:hypothetical protein RvY_12387-1 [Ramazzottius varieornatus]|uniref:TGF-beta propeptide domain-containing protein n=1 Tax=Ramazzottius varieornatus TaxID=947166 RepID=A0A1D1VLM5_RAMVA|nr:hypothetical protein RvY_12387-1 [Ramazzottius varieornatus]